MNLLHELFQDQIYACGTVRKKNGTKVAISCPQLVMDYNNSVGFVDKADMLKTTYETDRAENGGIEFFFIFLMLQL